MSEPLFARPHPCFVETSSILAEQLSQAATRLDAANFALLLDSLLSELLRRGMAAVGGDEGSVWLLDATEEHLVPVYNSGPRASEFVGRFRQPIGSGLISMVLASEQPFIENDVSQNPAQSKLLDQQLQVQTRAMVAAPFYLAKACRGVLTCVQLQKANSPSGAARPGFTPEALVELQRLATLLSRLLEYEMLSRVTGWTSPSSHPSSS